MSTESQHPTCGVWSHGLAEKGQSRRRRFTATTICTCKQLSGSGVDHYWTEMPKSMCGCCRWRRRGAGGQAHPQAAPPYPQSAPPYPQSGPCWLQGGRTYSGGSFPQERKIGQNYCPGFQNYYPALLSPFPGPLCYLFNPTGTKHCPLQFMQDGAIVLELIRIKASL